MYDVIVIGSGLGGMLSAASLSEKKKVLVLEQYKRIGGRFSSYDIEGYKVPTGAFHTIPYGENGIFAEFDRNLGINRVKNFKGYGHYYYKGRVYPIARRRDLIKIFNIFEYITLKNILYANTEKISPELSMADYLKKKHITQKTYSFFESFSAFAIGLFLSDIKAKEFIKIIQKLRYHRNPAYLKGGCGEFMNDLKNIILKNGGEIRTEEKVSEFISENSKIKSVKTDKGEYYGETFIYNGSPNILSEYKGNIIDIKPLKPACGVAVHFGSDEPVFDKPGIILGVGTKIIPGLVCQSVYDGTLAPEGRYLMSACFEARGKLKDDIQAVKDELALMFGKEKTDKLKVLRVCSYQKHWPANFAVQGTDLDGRTNYDNLFMVGDGCKERGYIMVEGVACSVKRILNLIDI